MVPFTTLLFHRVPTKKARPVAAMHYRKHSDSFQSRHEAGQNWVVMSSRSRLRVAVRTLIKTRGRTRRRIRRRGLPAHQGRRLAI